VAALLLGLPKVTLWLIIAFFLVTFFMSPLAFLVGLIIGSVRAWRDDCDKI